MIERKSKHSKIKNTGLVFEFLVRQVTSDLLINNKHNHAVRIIKEFFNNKTELGKEIQLYNTLIAEKFKSDKKADFLITETINTYRKFINQRLLKREKYNLIKEIKQYYDLQKFLSSKVDNYKLFASVYKLFENSKGMSPSEKTEIYFTILEHVTSNPKISKDISLSNIAKYKDTLSEDEDLRILSYRYLLEKFNKKYSVLDNNQRTLLKAYINNISNTNSLKEYINKKLPLIKKELIKNKGKIREKVVKIKLKEAINSINKFCKVGSKSKTVEDDVVVQMMRYYELIKELKK